MASVCVGGYGSADLEGVEQVDEGEVRRHHDGLAKGDAAHVAASLIDKHTDKHGTVRMDQIKSCREDHKRGGSRSSRRGGEEGCQVVPWGLAR